METPALEPLGEYHLIKHLDGTGQFADVFKACKRPRHAHDDPVVQVVAVKVLLRPGAGDDAVLGAEIDALAALAPHPCVLRYLETFGLSNGLRCVVTELHEGAPTLAVDIGLRMEAGRAFGEPEVFDVFNQLALGLDFLHANANGHGDVRSDNVLRLGPRVVLGDVKLVVGVVAGARDDVQALASVVHAMARLDDDDKRRWRRATALRELLARMQSRDAVERPDAAALCREVNQMCPMAAVKLQRTLADPFLAAVQRQLAIVVPASDAHNNNNNNAEALTTALQDAAAFGLYQDVVGLLRDHARAFVQVAREGCDQVAAMTGVHVKGADEAVVHAMAAHPNDADIAVRGCRALSAIARGAARPMPAACHAVVSAMLTVSNDEDVAVAGLRAMCDLSSHDDGDNRVALHKAGACDAVVNAMGEFPANVDVAYWTCCAVLSQDIALGQCGQCGAVVEALTEHRTVHKVALAGYHAVAKLARDSANWRPLRECGACQAVVAAARTFPNDRAIRLESVRAIEHLAMDPAARVELGECGACDVVVAALHAGPDDAACRAVVNLCKDDGNNLALLRGMGAAQIIARFSAHTTETDTDGANGSDGRAMDRAMDRAMEALQGFHTGFASSCAVV